MESFGTEIGVVAVEHMTEDFVILGDEEVIPCLQMLDDVECQGLGLGQVGGGATIETGARDGARGDVEDAVGRACLDEFDIDALDENLECGLGRAIDRKEGGGHETCDAAHHATTEIGRSFQLGIEALDETQDREGVDIYISDDVLLRHIAEQRQMTESSGDEERVDVGKSVEEGVVRFGQVEEERLELLVTVFVCHLSLINNINLLTLLPLSQFGCHRESDAIGTTYYQDSFHLFKFRMVCCCGKPPKEKYKKTSKNIKKEQVAHEVKRFIFPYFHLFFYIFLSATCRNKNVVLFYFYVGVHFRLVFRLHVVVVVEDFLLDLGG